MKYNYTLRLLIVTILLHAKIKLLYPRAVAIYFKFLWL